MNHLAQINALYPDAYMIKWEKPRNKRMGFTEQWDLVIKQNVQGNKDIAPFFAHKTLDEISPTKLSSHQTVPTNQPLSTVKQFVSPIKSRRERDFILRSPTKRPNSIVLCPSFPDTRVKMDAKRMMWRKMIFRHLLVERVRKAHDAFLGDKNLSHSDDQDVHPEYKKVINKITSDIPGSLPQKPVGSDLRDSDIRTFLQCLSKKPSKFFEREKTPEERSLEPVMKSEPQIAKHVKEEPQIPKTPLEQRLKAKFAAKAAIRNVKVSELQKRRGMLYRMKDDGILEMIRAHLNLNQSTTIGLANRELLQKLEMKLTHVLLLLEHLKLLCELVPKELCWLEPLNPSSGAEGYLFRISADIGPEWFPKILEIIAKNAC